MHLHVLRGGVGKDSELRIVRNEAPTLRRRPQTSLAPVEYQAAHLALDSIPVRRSGAKPRGLSGSGLPVPIGNEFSHMSHLR